MIEIKFPADFEDRTADAVRFFWATREGQISRQQSIQTRNQGNRGAVTGGKQLDGFVELVRDVLILNGVPEWNIFCNTGLELPGYYRPSKKWDLLVVDDGSFPAGLRAGSGAGPGAAPHKLIAAVEFKSQVGPSFGNNFNNRTEEAMGSALDIWTAYREGAFGTQEAPWLGYMMVLEDCPRSVCPVSARSPHFSLMPGFDASSYMKRYEIFCRKLVLERQYSAACFLTAKRDGDAGNYRFPAPEMSMRHFVSSLTGAALFHACGREG